MNIIGFIDTNQRPFAGHKEKELNSGMRIIIKVDGNLLTRMYVNPICIVLHVLDLHVLDVCFNLFILSDGRLLVTMHLQINTSVQFSN